MMVDPRDELYRLSRAVNDANLEVQIAATKIYGALIWMEPIDDAIFAEAFHALATLVAATGALHAYIITLQTQQKGHLQ